MSTPAMPSAPAASASAADKREAYLKHLLDQAVAAAAASGLELSDLRERAIALVGERSFPHSRDEEWRFSDPSAMMNFPFERARAIGAETLSETLLGSLCPALPGNSYRLVTLNGHYAASLSREGRASGAPELPEGAVIAPLSKLVAHPAYGPRIRQVIADKLAHTQGASEVFTALNTVGFSDVMVVWLRADQVIEAPIVIARASQGEAISHLRTLVIAEAHTRCTLVESFVGESASGRCNTSVTEILLGEGAGLTHLRLQDEGDNTFHIGKTAVSQAENSVYRCTALDLGAQFSRHHLEVYQGGPQTETVLYGLSALSNRQLADTHSLVALCHPHGRAVQLQKNIVDGQAHSVFNGKVFVAKEAQLTDASQLNRNLLLSDQGRVDTKPELDIVADNVKCAHGATVSQLQPDEIFYLQSRGIDADEAQRLLLYGFAMEIVDTIPFESLRKALSDRISQWTG